MELACDLSFNDGMYVTVIFLDTSGRQTAAILSLLCDRLLSAMYLPLHKKWLTATNMANNYIWPNLEYFYMNRYVKKTKHPVI